MTAKNFFIFQSIINGIFGLGLLLVPQMMTDSFAVQKTEVTGLLGFVGRSYGTLLIGVAVMAFLMRNAQASKARYAYIFGTVVACALILFVHIQAILQGVENSSGWLTVVLVTIIGAWSALLISKENSQDLL